MIDATNVKITDGNSLLPLSAGTIPTSVPSGVGTYDIKYPPFAGAYNFSLPDSAGVVAANNYLTIVNPAASGRTIILTALFVSTYVTSGASTTRSSLQGTLCGVATGGTSVAASAIAKLSSAYPTPIADVRTGNPTVTLGANVFNSPPPINATTSQYVHSVGAGGSPASGPLILAPGEGFCVHSAAGNTSQTWNISVVWGEI